MSIKNRGTLGINQIRLRVYDGENINPSDLGETELGTKFLPGDMYSQIMAAFDRVDAKPIFLDEEGGLVGCDDVVYTK